MSTTGRVVSVSGGNTAVLAALSGVTELPLVDREPSALELLSSALQDAMDAHRTGLIAGPNVDEVALRRAQRRALRADVARLLSAPGQGGAA